VITVWGGLVALVFLVCYLGQSVSTGLDGRKAKIVQWSCWLIAVGIMLLCYLLTEAPTG
jgi:hypothetical protein